MSRQHQEHQKKTKAPLVLAACASIFAIISVGVAIFAPEEIGNDWFAAALIIVLLIIIAALVVASIRNAISLSKFAWTIASNPKALFLDPQKAVRIHEADPMLLSPIEYEEYCQKKLADAGWAVSATKTTGDQGADIVADMRGIRAVIQCKRYGKPVGNSAVQEAVTAKAHYCAQIAVVVAPLGYTRAARELAASNRTLLLDHNTVANLEHIARIP